MVEMISVGRGAAAIRQRLYMWLWAAASTRGAGAPAVARSTGDWAELVNSIPDGAADHQRKRALGARRVANAIRYLESAALIRRDAEGSVELLDPDRSRRPFVPWSPAVRRERADERRRLESFFQERTDLRRGQFWEEDPIRVHASLWTSGIVSAL
ncbi:MAG: hypothetical protein ACR2HQ_12920, partial [Ilumatobacteraceae bacterium]